MTKQKPRKIKGFQGTYLQSFGSFLRSARVWNQVSAIDVDIFNIKHKTEKVEKQKFQNLCFAQYIMEADPIPKGGGLNSYECGNAEFFWIIHAKQWIL